MYNMYIVNTTISVLKYCKNCFQNIYNKENYYCSLFYQRVFKYYVISHFSVLQLVKRNKLCYFLTLNSLPNTFSQFHFHPGLFDNEQGRQTNTLNKIMGMLCSNRFLGEKYVAEKEKKNKYSGHFVSLQRLRAALALRCSAWSKFQSKAKGLVWTKEEH